jgi:acyl carrier protein
MPGNLQSHVADTYVHEIISRATLVPLDQLTPEARPEALGIDSLGLVEVIFALEEAFDIKVPVGAHLAATGLDITSIGSITAGVQALVAARRAA